MPDHASEMSPNVARCVELVLEDHARQGGYITIDDVGRISSRRRLDGEETATLWLRLRALGIVISGVYENETEAKLGSIETVNKSSVSPKGSDWAFGQHVLLSHQEEIRLARRI